MASSMKKFAGASMAMLLSLGLLSCAQSEAAEPTAEAQLAFESITVLAFSADGTLFIGDSGTGTVHAVQPPPAENPNAEQGYNLRNIDATIAELLGTTTTEVRVRDLAVHPMTKEAYLAVGRVTDDDYASAVVIINQAGEARLLDPTLAGETLEVPFAPTDEFFFYRDVPSRDLTFTDLEIHDGRLYIAGMSNADFASSLWATPIPFDGEASTTTVEIYHGVHGQQETRAPIRSMKVVDIDGTDHMVASYTCTPLVVFPLSDIEDGAHISGKTIAELGFGNTPGDIIAFDGQDPEQNPIPLLFIQHKNQSPQVIPMQAIAGAAAGEGITEPLGTTTVDLGASNVPMTNILQVEDQDPGRLVAVRRDAEQGDIELVSYLKNVYFRLSDFQSEYEIPGYEYPPEQDMIRQFQNVMKIDEGYPELVVE